jgi:hypothetical protein
MNLYPHVSRCLSGKMDESLHGDWDHFVWKAVLEQEHLRKMLTDPTERSRTTLLRHFEVAELELMATEWFISRRSLSTLGRSEAERAGTNSQIPPANQLTGVQPESEHESDYVSDDKKNEGDQHNVQSAAGTAKMKKKRRSRVEHGAARGYGSPDSGTDDTGDTNLGEGTAKLSSKDTNRSAAGTAEKKTMRRPRVQHGAARGDGSPDSSTDAAGNTNLDKGAAKLNSTATKSCRTTDARNRGRRRTSERANKGIRKQSSSD